jgi:WD40 repeat protein
MSNEKGRVLMSGGNDGEVGVWVVVGTKLVFSNVFKGHFSSISALSSLPNSLLFSSLSSDGNLRLWNLSSSLLLQKLWVNSFGGGGRRGRKGMGRDRNDGGRGKKYSSFSSSLLLISLISTATSPTPPSPPTHFHHLSILFLLLDPQENCLK